MENQFISREALGEDAEHQIFIADRKFSFRKTILNIRKVILYGGIPCFEKEVSDLK
jgi:hypothetical protein